VTPPGSSTSSGRAPPAPAHATRGVRRRASRAPAPPPQRAPPRRAGSPGAAPGRARRHQLPAPLLYRQQKRMKPASRQRLQRHTSAAAPAAGRHPVTQRHRSGAAAPRPLASRPAGGVRVMWRRGAPGDGNHLCRRRRQAAAGGQRCTAAADPAAVSGGGRARRYASMQAAQNSKKSRHLYRHNSARFAPERVVCACCVAMSQCVRALPCCAAAARPARGSRRAPPPPPRSAAAAPSRAPCGAVRSGSLAAASAAAQRRRGSACASGPAATGEWWTAHADIFADVADSEALQALLSKAPAGQARARAPRAVTPGRLSATVGAVTPRCPLAARRSRAARAPRWSCWSGCRPRARRVPRASPHTPPL
jgi:hypothetical protein